jgi:hypothetical protein
MIRQIPSSDPEAEQTFELGYATGLVSGCRNSAWQHKFADDQANFRLYRSFERALRQPLGDTVSTWKARSGTIRKKRRAQRQHNQRTLSVHDAQIKLFIVKHTCCCKRSPL